MSRSRLFRSALFRRFVSPVGLVVLGVLHAGCPASKPMQVPPSEAAMVSPGAAWKGGDKPTASGLSRSGVQEDGAICFRSVECASGQCEGASCDRTQPGNCVSANRPCTANLVEYCACGGRTFSGSGSCPGEPIRHRGSCEDGPEQTSGS